MNNFWCPECKLVLNDHEINTEKEYVTSEYFGQVATTESDYFVCCACGSDVYECVVCSKCKSSLPIKGGDDCLMCALVADAEFKEIVGILRPLSSVIVR